jgi:Fe-S cluster biogenesis protein NfuA
MNNTEQKVLEVLHNVNWLLEAHNSFAELVEISGNKVVLRCKGHCAECETNCIGVAFQERMPDIELVFQ